MIDKKIYDSIQVFIMAIFVILTMVISFCISVDILFRIKFVIFISFIQTILISLYCFRNQNFKNRFALFAFNITFFILLQSSYLVNIFNDEYFGIYIFQEVTSISLNNELKGVIYIYITQFFVFISYFINRSSSKKTIILQNNDNTGLIHWSLITMFVGGCAAFLKMFFKIIYVINYGYLGLYLADGTALFQNPFLDLFDSFYTIGLFGYLSTFPSRDKIKMPLLIFFIFSIFTLFTGQRGDIVINILFIIWYLLQRDRLYNSDKPILSWKKLLLFGIIGVFFIAFLYTIGYSRVGVDTSNLNIFDKLINFLDTQGRSGKLVALGFEYEQQLQQYMSKSMFVFSPIKSFIMNNSFSRILFGSNLGQTLSNLSDFGSTLTYLTNPEAYLGGAGLGTSFVVEVALAYGIIGIIIVSFIIGKLLHCFDNLNKDNWCSNVLLMNAFGFLIYIPRHSTLGVIPGSFTTIIFVISVSLLVNNVVKIKVRG